jgi:predicted ATPase/class 3 adenylate cyclase
VPVTDTARRLPTGTVTFLRTDVEGSMRLVAALGSGWDALNERQLSIIRGAAIRHGGVIVRTEGDALFGAFDDATGALTAAIDAQRQIEGEPWPDGATIRIRIGLHSGEAHLAGDDYGGFDVNRAARIAAVGHGGQIVLSDPTRALVAGSLPDGVTIRDLGRHVLRDVPYPEQLFQADVPGLATDFPPIRTRLSAPGNLPRRLTSFVGREADLRAARDLLASGRLLTITGPGGIGKTSFAIELGHAVAPDYADGGWLVPLDAVSDASEVPGAAARALGLYDGPGRSPAEGVFRHLAEREQVLVIDNFEHVLDAASFVGRLLQGAPDVRLIVTSRAPLRIAGEQEYPLGPLARDGDDGAELPPAVRLFVDRARGARPAWDPGPELPAVHEVCRLLDDLPLGIELAAARVALLPVTMIRDRLLARLPLPGPGPRGVPERQRTLESAITWSLDLLDESQRRLLRQLSVFDGGFDLDQAGAVAGRDGADVLDDVIALADHSLVVRDARSGAETGPGGLRYRLLETIRSLAMRELEARGELATVRGRHAGAYLELAETAARHWLTQDQARWLDRLAQDHENLRAAVEWSIDHGPVETAQRLSAALWRYWQFEGRLREGRELTGRVAALAIDEPTPARLWALGAAGGMAYWQADTPEANACYLEQLAVARQVGDLAGEADALFNLSATDFIMGGRETSMAYLLEARALYERLGDTKGAARTLWGEHNVVVYSGQPEDAREILDRLGDTFERNGDVMYQALSAGSYAFMSLMEGDVHAAIRAAGRAMSMHYVLRDVTTATITLVACALGFIEVHDPRAAATALGAYDALSERYGVKPPAGLGFMLEQFRAVDRTIEALRVEEYAEAYGAGARMSLDEAVAFTLETIDRASRRSDDRGEFVQPSSG